MGFNKKNNKTDRAGSTALSTKPASGQSPVEALLQSLIVTAQKNDASSLHLYSNSKSKNCYFEVAGKLLPTGKKLTDKVIDELLDYIIDTSNLEKSELNQAQTASISLDGTKLEIVYLQNSLDESSHLIINLGAPSSIVKIFEDIGLWGRSLELLESALDYGKGIILIDSKDQYAVRTLLSSSIEYLKGSNKVTSISFDSGNLPSLNIKDHDRIFTKINRDSKSIIKRSLNSSPSVIAFLDTLNKETISIAVEQSLKGKLVFLVTTEGGCSSSLKRLLDMSDQNDLLSELKLIISLSPIQTIANSNGYHKLDDKLIIQIENFFGLEMPESWSSIYSHAGIKSPEELLKLNFPIVSEYKGLTNLVEVFRPDDYIIRTLERNPNLSLETIHQLTIRAGNMLTKRQDGLIKSLRKEVDLADVIDSCK